MRLLLTIGVVVLLIIADFNLIKGSFDSNFRLGQVKEESLKIDQLQGQNQNLKDDLARKQSPFFIEKEARDLLNYQKPGEITAVVGGKGFAANQDQKEKAPLSNWQKWWNLLFS